MATGTITSTGPSGKYRTFLRGDTHKDAPKGTPSAPTSGPTGQYNTSPSGVITTPGGKIVGTIQTTKPTPAQDSGLNYTPAQNYTPARPPPPQYSSEINYTSAVGYSTKEGYTLLYERPKRASDNMKVGVPTFEQQRQTDIFFASRQLAKQQSKEKEFFGTGGSFLTKTKQTFTLLPEAAKTGFAFSARPAITQTGRFIEQDATKRYEQNIDNNRFSQRIRFEVANLGTSLRTEPGKQLLYAGAGYGVGRAAGFLGAKAVTGVASSVAARKGAEAGIIAGQRTQLFGGLALAGGGAASIAFAKPGDIGRSAVPIIAGGVGFSQGYRATLPRAGSFVSGVEATQKGTFSNRGTVVRTRGEYSVLQTQFGLSRNYGIPFRTKTVFSTPAKGTVKQTTQYLGGPLKGRTEAITGRFDAGTGITTFTDSKTSIRAFGDTSFFGGSQRFVRSASTTEAARGGITQAIEVRGGGFVTQRGFFLSEKGTGSTAVRTNVLPKTQNSFLGGRRGQISIGRPEQFQPTTQFQPQNTVFNPTRTTGITSLSGQAIPKSVYIAPPVGFVGAIPKPVVFGSFRARSTPVSRGRTEFSSLSFGTPKPGTSSSPFGDIVGRTTPTAETTTVSLFIPKTTTGFTPRAEPPNRIFPRALPSPPPPQQPFIGAPFPNVPLFGISSGSGRERGGGFQSFSYAPSLTSVLFNIRGRGRRDKKKALTGFELRPL